MIFGFPPALYIALIVLVAQIWWYIGIFGASIVMALATCYTAHSQLPWWGLFVALIFAAAFIPVIGTVRILYHFHFQFFFSRL